MKKLLLLFVGVLVLVSCQKETALETSAIENLNLNASSIDSNIGVYKGVFTTLDSKERATVVVTITDATTFAPIYGSKATAVLHFEKGNTISATAIRPIEIGQAIDELEFTSTALNFMFSVESDGKSPSVSNVTYKNKPSDILIVKHSTRNPVNPVLGTFVCTGCNGNTTVTNAVSQTFNMTVTNGVIATQAVVDESSYQGDGLEATAADNGDGTSSAAISGSVITPGSTVDFAGTHTFSTTGDDCSEITGTWTWNTNNAVTGTFESDTSCDSSTGPVELINEDFEDATVSYTVDGPGEYSDGSEDYFIRTDESNIANAMAFSNKQGSFFFGAHDLDNAVPGNSGGSKIREISFNNIDVSDLTSFTFSGYFAEDDDGGNQDWDDKPGTDSDDYLKVQYSFDGGTSWTTFFAIEGSNAGNFNGEPAIDTDFDGVGDGARITDTFTMHQASFTNGGGSATMNIKILINLDSGDEDIAIDSVIVTGN